MMNHCDVRVLFVAEPEMVEPTVATSLNWSQIQPSWCLKHIARFTIFRLFYYLKIIIVWSINFLTCFTATYMKRFPQISWVSCPLSYWYVWNSILMALSFMHLCAKCVMNLHQSEVKPEVLNDLCSVNARGSLSSREGLCCVGGAYYRRGRLFPSKHVHLALVVWKGDSTYHWINHCQSREFVWWTLRY